MATNDRLVLTCSDGVVLNGILFKPEQEARGAVIFLSGAGIKKDFYKKFCNFISEHGYYVLSFDNRGIGENNAGSLRGCTYNLLEWAQQDTHAAIEYCKQQFPSLPIMIVGHSMGAQLVGFTENNSHLKAVIGIATSTGTWWKLKRSHMFASMLLWYVIHPVLTPLFGYAPLRYLGIMENLPKRVIKQWSAWCRSEFYFADHLGKTIPMDSFYPLRVPLIVHYFKDDPIATDKTVTDFTALYRGTRTRMIKHRAKDYHQKKVGHFRMFHADFEKSFWRIIVHEVDRFLQPDHG